VSKQNVKELTEELSALLERNADDIRLQWVKEMQQTGLLSSLSPREIDEQSRAIYDACVLCLKSGSYEGAERYAANMARKGVLEAMTVDQIIAGLLILRDVYGRFIFEWYKKNPTKCNAILTIYEPVARKILNIVALAFVAEREATIKEQQKVLAFSTPIVEVGEGIVALPLVGTLDSARAKQVTEAILEYIAKAQTDVVLVDISGIAAIDTKTANYIIRAMQAVKLMGSDVVITGIRPDVASTLVTIGIDLTGIVTRSTVREGLVYANEKLGRKITSVSAS